MKYSIIAGFLLLFGIGEYAFVELAPLAPERRMDRFQQFPVVKQVVDLENRRLVNDAFERDQDGVLVHATSRDTTRWASADELWKDYKNGNFKARIKIREIKRFDEMEEGLEQARQRALEGSTLHKIDYAILARATSNEQERTRAEDLLEEDSSATAQWFWNVMIRPQRVSPTSAEGMTLMVRRMVEDLHHPDWPDAPYHKYASQDSMRLVHISEAASRGESAADSVVTQLRQDYGIDLDSVLANWNGGHFEHPAIP